MAPWHRGDLKARFSNQMMGGVCPSKRLFPPHDSFPKRSGVSGATDLLRGLGREAARPTRLALGAGAAQALAAVPVAWIAAGVVDSTVFHGGDLANAWPALAALAALFLLRAGLGALADTAAFRAGAEARRILFARLLDHVAALGPLRRAGIADGEVAVTLTDAVQGIEPYWRNWLPATAAAAVLPAAIILAVLPVDWPSVLVFAGTAPLLPVFMYLVGVAAERANQRQWEAMARLGGHLLDAVRGLADLTLFRAARREIGVVRRTADIYRRDTMGVLRIAFLSALVLEFFATVSIAITAVLVGFRLMWGVMDFRDGLFILLLAPAFYAPVRVLGAERHARMEAVAAAERIAALLAVPAPVPGTNRPPLPAACEVRFENVSFSHDGSRRVLDNVSFTLAPGSRTAVVGASGAGKSTLLSLILGFAQPDAGRVLIDGVRAADYDPEALRERIALVPQQTLILDDTIAGNVAMGRSGDVAGALRAAGAWDAVQGAAEGLDTRLGERGQGLSGGEARRLAIARALFATAPLVLLDEPTAHLDRATEERVAESLARATAGRTVLTIAHRPGAVRDAERVLVFERGRLVEDGTPEALARSAGPFARMRAAWDGEAAR
jgi:ATP-binding cassette, subfamily C, bacterial CydD